MLAEAAFSLRLYSVLAQLLVQKWAMPALTKAAVTLEMRIGQLCSLLHRICSQTQVMYACFSRRWKPGQPDNLTGHGDEDCAHLYDDGLLNDVHCSIKMQFICQKPTLNAWTHLLPWLCPHLLSDYTAKTYNIMKISHFLDLLLYRGRSPAGPELMRLYGAVEENCKIVENFPRCLL